MNIIDTFRYLVSLEEHKHFSRRSGLSHNAASAFKCLEISWRRKMGVKIVNRGRNYEGLTAEGKGFGLRLSGFT